MALSGQLSDLSLAELIEFFCNQRKTGRLKVAYEVAPGYFYFDRGDLVDARVGSLNGVEAIYYALTLANASFKFSPSFEATRRTIHQPWTQVTLEGLRRLDEGIKPKAPAPVTGVLPAEDLEEAKRDRDDEAVEYEGEIVTPLSMMVDSAASGGRSKMVYAAIALAVVALVAVAGIPAGWYKSKAATANTQPVAEAPAEPQPSAENAEAAPAPEQQTADPASTEPTVASSDMNAIAAKRAREARERARQAEAARQAAASGQPGTEAPKKPEAAKPGPRMVSVQVTYDEAGRVTQTSGGDGTAQRIARQKRFPAGKAGTTTVTIPIN